MLYFMIKVTLLLVVPFYILYKYSTRKYKHWEKRGIPYVKPTPFFGNMYKVFTFRKALGDLLASYYHEYKSPYFGIYAFDKPVLVIRSPDLIKNILVKDFSSFSDRYVMSNEKCDPLASNMLFFAKNPEWKFVRTKMTPTFTTGKLKAMFCLIKDAGNDMISYLNKCHESMSIECKEVCGKYSTDVITSCAFGLNANCFKSENAPFRQVSRQMFDFSWKSGFSQVSYFMAHNLVKLLKLRFLDVQVSDFLRKVFWDTLKEREQSSIVRHDVIDVIKEFKNKPYLNKNFEFVGDRILAQAVQFFGAGFETVSSTISFALYELSLNPEIQNRLRLEIKNTLLEHKEINYNAIQSMKYLTMVVQETLRKYPSLPFIERVCLDNYQVPNEKLIIEKGVPVYISLLGLHTDPDYFPDPQVFNPERFANDEKEKSFNYIPFGEGPRNCIGGRFGLLVTKTGLVDILTEFRVEPTANTPIPINFSTTSFFLSSAVGIPLKFCKANVLN